MVFTMTPMKAHRRVAAILLTTTAVALVPAASFGATKTVTARSSAWGPAKIEIVRGTTLEWVNPSGFLEHSIKAYGGWRYYSYLAPGAETSRRFRELGRFKYRCEFHSTKRPGSPCEGMCGVVKVVAPS